MKKILKMAAAVLAVGAVMAFGATAMAADYTTSDGVLTVTTPDDTWQEISDPYTWVTLANGTDTITLEHYRNGDMLPPMTVANDQYSKVYQTVLSNKNEVFIITGSVVDATNFTTVRKAVESVVINKFDTLTTEVKKQDKSNSGYIVSDETITLYVISDSLNVRAGYSTNDQVIGGLVYGDEVHVTGVVLKDGEDTGWFRIGYNGGSGYISSSFVSDEQPVVTVETAPEPTGNEVFLFSSTGQEADVYEYTDGNWYDYYGNRYVAEGGGQWSCSNGTHWSTDNSWAQSSAPNTDTSTSNSMSLTRPDGYVVIYQASDGNWYDGAGTAYEPQGAGQWTDSKGYSWSAY